MYTCLMPLFNWELAEVAMVEDVPSHRLTVSLELPSLALLFLEWGSSLSSLSDSRWSTHRCFRGEGDGPEEEDAEGSGSDPDAQEYAGGWLKVLILIRDFSPEFTE